MEGGVDDLLTFFCQNHLQVLEGFLFLLFDLPLFLFGSMFCFCNHGDGYFLILVDFIRILPLLSREEGECIFQ